MNCERTDVDGEHLACRCCLSLPAAADPVGFITITHAMEVSFVGSRDISNVCIVPCNPGCDVSATPKDCFCLLIDLQPWIWVPVDIHC